MTKSAQQPHGFALIIALVMMGFLLMLVLSLSSLTGVNITGSNIEQNSKHAQRNALLALNIALGQLQEYAGPDRHTSARADVSVTATDAAPAHPYWTGVWGYTGDDFGLQTYLVSGNHTQSTPLALDALTDPLTDAESVTLLTATGTDPVSGNSTGKVVAQRVSISEGGETVGSYAYWISDEGIKAKINLANLPVPDDAIDNFALLNPQQFGVNQITDLTWFPMKDSQAIQSLIDNGTLALLASATDEGNPAAIRNHFHDITLYSYGVLSDSNKGGLKRDLSVGLLENSSTPAATDQIFGRIDARTDGLGASGLSATVDPGGPLWSQLRNWVNTELDGGNSLPVQAATDAQPGFAPVVTGFQLYFVPVYNRVNASYNTAFPADNSRNNAYRTLEVMLVPAIVLWNPYDVTLGNNETYRVELGRQTNIDQKLVPIFSTPSAGSTNSRDLWIKLQRNNPYDYLRAAYGNQNSPNDRYSQSASGNIRVDGNDVTIQFDIGGVTLAPGESKVYSLKENRAYFTRPTTAPYYLEEGYRQLGAYSPLRDAPSSSANPRMLNPNPEYETYKANNPGMENDPSVPESLPYLMHFEYGFNTSRSTSLLLYRKEGTSNNWQLLNESVYLNITIPLDGNAPPPAEIQQYPTTSTAQIDLSGAIGYKLVRRFTNNDNALLNSNTHARPSSDLKWLVDTNPRATTSGPNPLNYLAPSDSHSYSTTTNPSYISLLDTGSAHTFIDSNSNNAYVAHRETAGTGSVTKSALFEAPRGLGNLFSVGQLTHAPLYYWKDANPQLAAPSNSLNRIVNSRFDNLIPAYPIGNSQANPAIPLNAIYRNIGDIGLNQTYFSFDGLLYDYSYLLNEALLDSYFFSTLVESDGKTPSTTALNPRIVPINGAAATADYTRSAAQLMVDGAFNINSTSVEAWKALLSSYYGQQVNSNSHNDAAPILRVLGPTGSSFTGTGTSAHNQPAAYQGYRTLDEAQINSLANAIVKEIKAYAKVNGPFSTLAQFVNRNPRSTVQEHQIKGVLARAIEASKVNEALAYSSYKAEADRVVSMFNTPASEGYRTEGLPGWLTSADIVSRLGSVLSARSDTFLIRAYGEYTGPSSNVVQSKAWCEAVVQRLPDYIDGVTAAEADPVGLNEQFGRRFVVVSFRWLTEDDL